jgi:hypothetical protein
MADFGHFGTSDEENSEVKKLKADVVSFQILFARETLDRNVLTRVLRYRNWIPTTLRTGKNLYGRARWTTASTGIPVPRLSVLFETRTMASCSSSHSSSVTGRSMQIRNSILPARNLRKW